MDLLGDRESPGDSLERVVGIYRVLKPHLVATYATHLAAANPTYEPPTRRILERCLDEERRHVAAGRVVLGQVLRDEGCRARAAAWEAQLGQALDQAGGVTGQTASAARSFEVGDADPGCDLVALNSAFDPDVIAHDLRAAVQTHAAAVAAGDLDRAAAQVAPASRLDVLPVYAATDPARAWEILAQAKVGRRRLVKLGLTGARGTSVLLLQWQQVGGEWRVVQAEVARAAPAP
jgi:hypothetical protein